MATKKKSTRKKKSLTAEQHVAAMRRNRSRMPTKGSEAIRRRKL